MARLRKDADTSREQQTPRPSKLTRLFNSAGRKSLSPFSKSAPEVSSPEPKDLPLPPSTTTSPSLKVNTSSVENRSQDLTMNKNEEQSVKGDVGSSEEYDKIWDSSGHNPAFPLRGSSLPDRMSNDPAPVAYGALISPASTLSRSEESDASTATTEQEGDEADEAYPFIEIPVVEQAPPYQSDDDTSETTEPELGPPRHLPFAAQLHASLIKAYEANPPVVKAGPYKITNAKTARELYKSLLSTYLVYLSVAVSLGPTALFDLLWFTWVVATLYQVLVIHMNWQEDDAPDVFITVLLNLYYELARGMDVPGLVEKVVRSSVRCYETAISIIQSERRMDEPHVPVLMEDLEELY
ncbi:hypothetical protein M011DRAFT_479518 [Sporormia fimetaria CBS 119925]|uniref:Uncharacterized protein n=1 Tax=Sporormia fimetaria CBS 119925 TaxID=1340428 RepID=A0A6A6V2Q2_9PLEO|nr:hypothetical protein M011DRAFT_479518 [Sporormia fimetaria CBS 119925]